MRSIKSKKGVALITTVGILYLLTIIATSFVVTMMSDYKSVVSYRDSMVAKYAADAGLNLGIAYMRDLALTSFNATPLDGWRHMNGTLASGKSCVAYSLDVTDTASQININDPNPNLKNILENIAAIIGSPLAAGDGNAIVNGRPSGGYITKEQLMEYAGFDRAKYEAIKDYITTDSYIDPDSDDSTHGPPYSPKSPVNINTASEQVIRAVLTGVVASDKAQSLASAIISYRSSNPFLSWSQFDNFIDTAVISPSLDSTDKSNIKLNANPNRTKPGVFTTDFCFHPSGYCEIKSTGSSGIDVNGDGDLDDAQDKVNSRKTVTSLIKIYGILGQTTKEQFQGNDGDTVPVAFKVNTFDSCPVEPIDSANSWDPGSDYKTVPDSIKNGFWDNMNDAYSVDKSMFYINGQWVEASASNRLSYIWYPQNDPSSLLDANSDGKYELVFMPMYADPYNSPIAVLGREPVAPPEVTWDCFSFRSTNSDGIPPSQKNIATGRSDYNQSDVMMPFSRHTIGLDDTLRMKQEYEESPTTGQFLSQIGGGEYYGTHDGGAYYVVNTTIAVTIASNNHYFYAYQKNNARPYFQLYDHDTAISSNASGQIGWQAHGAMIPPNLQCWTTNVRVIPQNGAYFISNPLAVPEGNVRWGTVGATVTLGQGADPDSEKLYFQTSTDGGSTWMPAAPGVSPGNGITSAASSSIQYKANFTTLDDPASGLGTAPYFSETIAFEDVTITYLPAAHTIYYREGAI